MRFVLVVLFFIIFVFNYPLTYLFEYRTDQEWWNNRLIIYSALFNLAVVYFKLNEKGWRKLIVIILLGYTSSDFIDRWWFKEVGFNTSDIFIFIIVLMLEYYKEIYTKIKKLCDTSL